MYPEIGVCRSCFQFSRNKPSSLLADLESFLLRLLDQHSLLYRLSGLVVVGAGRWLAKHQLSLELPGVRETPGRFYVRNNAGVEVEVLKVGSKTLRFKSSPG